jgi:hypothetical protein
MLPINISEERTIRGDAYGRARGIRSGSSSPGRERSALFGIVQALLVTKHLLFVGYSLSDDDFHQLVDEIRIATASSNPEADTRLGTVLMTDHWPLASLWSDLLHKMLENLGAPSTPPQQQTARRTGK